MESVISPNRDTIQNDFTNSGSSFLNSDTDPSSPSSLGVSSPLSSDSMEFGNAAAFLMPVRPKPAPPLSKSRLYPSFEHGAPLSDIGEEDLPRFRRAKSRTPSPIASSPTIAPQSPPPSIQRREKRLSEFSNSSNVSTGSDQNWDGFDDMAGMSERLKADLAAMGDDSFDLDGSGGQRSSVTTMGDEEHVTLALSKRAEQILATAKKRLTHMEGNLSRARTTLPGPAKQPSSLGEHKEVGGLYRSISQGGDRRLGLGSTLRKSRPSYHFTKGPGFSHTKNLSETSVPSAAPRYGQPVEARCASAMEYGSTSASIDAMIQNRSSNTAVDQHTVPPGFGRNGPLPVVLEAESSPSTKLSSTVVFNTRNTSRRFANAHSRNRSHDSVLGLRRSRSTLSTKEAQDGMNGASYRRADEDRDRRVERTRRSSLQNLRSQSSFAAAKEWYAGAAEYSGPGSPLSTNAGKGCKNEGAQRDARWERSTSSPTSPQSPDAQGAPKSPGSPFLTPESPIDKNPHFGAHQRQDSDSPTSRSFLRTFDGDRDDETSYIQESHYEDAFEGRSEDIGEPIAASEEEQIYLNEVLEESLQDAEPQIPAIPDASYTTAVSERHEDRADAFDYENFFLHSALGNYSQSEYHERNISQATAGSRLSYDSTSSAETTRAPQTASEDNGLEEVERDSDEAFGRVRTETGTFLDDELPTPTGPRPPFASHFRNNSVDSISSAETFATATEGGSGNGGIEEELDNVPTEILRWGKSSPPNIIGAWPSPPTTAPRRPPPPTQRNGHRHGHSSPLIPAGAFESLHPASDEIFPRAPPSPLSRTGPNNNNNDSSSNDPNSPVGAGDAESHTRSSTTPSDHRPPPNTEILISALITLANPDFQSHLAPFAEADQDLVISLLRSVGAACEGINAAGTERREGRDAYASRLFRQRLDLARRVLEGEEGAEEEEEQDNGDGTRRLDERV